MSNRNIDALLEGLGFFLSSESSADNAEPILSALKNGIIPQDVEFWEPFEFYAPEWIAERVQEYQKGMLRFADKWNTARKVCPSCGQTVNNLYTFNGRADVRCADCVIDLEDSLWRRTK